LYSRPGGGHLQPLATPIVLTEQRGDGEQLGGNAKPEVVQ